MIEISKNLGEYQKIEEYEPNPFIRKTKYPLVTHIKIDTYKYKDEYDKIHNKTVTTKKYCGNKSVIDRRLRMKKFGDAINSNENITTVGEPVNMEMVNSKTKIFGKKLDNNTNTNICSKKNNLYKPTKVAINQNNTIKYTKEPEYKVILRNIPTHYTIADMSNILKTHLKDFGLIKSIRLIKDKYDNLSIRDIAFVEFFYEKDMNKFLSNKNRIIIDNSIIDFERMRN